ncbi:MAG: flagellin [Candidatus Thiodiazotropha sp. (ex Dulcina madagascariensis)]|nr:flagellin [Candidatus Thiodiazotropha sp. (ex Dulcina madagascariensis)]MCU7927889.1 flagellin [Candidatus Thiodiazotropha sp. (ex Dulcina madagascariensis)]
MAMVINTNISALNTQRSLNNSQSSLATSMQRLSTGLRINSAKDDAAGLGITDRMTSQVRGLNQAIRNAGDAISLSQTAEGSMQEATNLLQRMRELAIQSANDSNSSADRANLQKEVAQLQQELNRIADTSTFNGKQLLDGTFSAQKFHVGSNANETISVSVTSIRATSLGNQAVSANTNVGGALTAAADASGGNNVAAQNLTISGQASSGALAVAIDDAASDIAALVNGASATTNVTATASNSVAIDGLSLAGTVSLTLSSSNSGGTVGSALTVSAAITTTDYGALADAINAVSASTGVSAVLAADSQSITLENTTGHDINVVDFVHSGDAAETLDVGGVTLTGPTGGVPTVTDSLVVGGTVSFSSSGTFVVATDTGTTVMGAASTSSALSSVASIDVGTQSGSNNALDVLDQALRSISDARADLGAIQNRLESTIANLSNISENVTAARSRVQDADFAAETSNMTRAQILQQAGVAMLSQANAQPQLVLSLLQ